MKNAVFHRLLDKSKVQNILTIFGTRPPLLDFIGETLRTTALKHTHNEKLDTTNLTDMTDAPIVLKGPSDLVLHSSSF